MLRFFLFALLIANTAAFAQPQNPIGNGTIRVATRIVPPFVMRSDDGKLTGFSVELWDALGRELGMSTQWIECGTVPELLSKVRSKKAEAGIAAISITSERQRVLDFSQPMFDAGLQILVRDTTGGNNTPTILQVFMTPAMRQALLLVLVLILLPAHIVWLVERNREDGIIENKQYFPGIFKALWWAAGTLGAQADEMPRSPLGRFVAVFWMFTGIAFVAYFTAIITASMTISQLHGEINGPDDLPGKRIATVSGSTSQKYLTERGLRATEVTQFQDAAKLLEAGKVQAVVFDAPVLMYYAANAGKDRTHVVGPIFRKESYGIAFPTDSTLRTRVNYTLLKLKESGEYNEIYEKWFNMGQDE